MCTVTFLTRRGGYALGMNRDEKLSRLTALPPAVRRVGGRVAIYPSEPGGGTWIGLNDDGMCLALINWYAVPGRVVREAISRGEVVKSVLGAEEPAFVDETVMQMGIERVNPFRLIGVFPKLREVIEWRWNLRLWDRRQHPWKNNIWISSGSDEPGAQRVRRQVFAEAMRQEASGRLGWLRQLHQSHQPERGPHAICMHREDAATVSYTEVTISRNEGAMRYQPGSPCAAGAESQHHLKLRGGGMPSRRVEGTPETAGAE